MRRPALAAFATAAALLAAGPAHAASTFTIKGAGFGHGVGMSQFGALGYAQNGATYRDILSHYYSGTSLGQTSTDSIVRVLLRSSKAAVFTGATRANDRPLQADQVYRVTAALDGSLELRSDKGHKLASFTAPLQVTGDQPLTLRGPADNGLRDGQYRGWLEFRSNAVGHVLAINAIGLEQYAAGVVSAESPSSWPAAALEAQAVAARTYAITTSAGASQGFTQFADTRSQMYRGVAAETASTNAAVNATRGQVVTYAGRPVVTYFFSTSGGRTENVEDSVLGDTKLPWLRSVVDPYDSVSPWHRWTVRMPMTQAAHALKGLFRGHFQGIAVVSRGASPRVRLADVVGTKGSTRVNGATLRSRLGLRDTWAYFRAVTTDKPKPPASDSGGGASASRAITVLTGRVFPIRAGSTLRVEWRVGSSWQLVATALAGRGGAYHVEVPAAGQYRVIAGDAIGPVVSVTRRRG